LNLTDGNLAVSVANASLTSQLPRTFDLRGDALAIDHGWEHQWYFRIAGDAREFALRSLGGVTQAVVAPGVHADREYADLDSRGLLAASWDLDVYRAGPASGVFISRLTLLNRSNAPVSLDLFCYTDFDIAGTAGDDTATGTNSRHFVTDATGVQIEVRAIGNDLSAVAAYPALRNLLTNLTPDNLSGVLPPFTGDYTGAFQWQNRTLQPLEERTFQVIMAVDTAAAVPPLVEHYGAGNSTTFRTHTQQLPLQDNAAPRQFAVQMRGALPNVEYRIASGFQPLPPFPFIPGLDLWIDPASIFAVFAGFTNANGEAQEVFTLPSSPYLTGFSVVHQCFAVDAAAPNGYAVYSPGLLTRIGKL
jgi:hypothetical protein